MEKILNQSKNFHFQRLIFKLLHRIETWKRLNIDIIAKTIVEPDSVGVKFYNSILFINC